MRDVEKEKFQYFSLVVKSKIPGEIGKVEAMVKPLLDSKEKLFDPESTAPLKIVAYCHDNLDAKAGYSEYLLELIEDNRYIDGDKALSLKGFMALGYPDLDGQAAAEKEAYTKLAALETGLVELESKSYELEDAIGKAGSPDPREPELKALLTQIEETYETIADMKEEREGWYLSE
jgi:hypothetical protein